MTRHPRLRRPATFALGTVLAQSAPPADAPPHFTQGMIHQFTVA